MLGVAQSFSAGARDLERVAKAIIQADRVPPSWPNRRSPEVEIYVLYVSRILGKRSEIEPQQTTSK